MISLRHVVIPPASNQETSNAPVSGLVVGRMDMEERFGVNDPELAVGGPLARQLPLSGVSEVGQPEPERLTDGR